MWVPPEVKDPIVLQAPTRKSMAIFGAVRLDTGRLLTMTSDVFNAVTFQSFLEYLLSRTYRKKIIVMILDNCKYHHAKHLKPWLEEHRDAIRLEFLPPYSPDLNPIERVWKLTRKLCIHDHYFATLDELLIDVKKQFAPWEKPNRVLRKLCAVK